MPASDKCEPQIIKAFNEAGWKLLRKHYPIRLGKSKGAVFADLRLEHEGKFIIVVEIKCFSDPNRLLDEVYHAIGQYLIYRNALKLSGNHDPIFLALPHTAYPRLIDRDAVHITLEDAKIKMVLVDIEQAKIIQWLD